MDLAQLQAERKAAHGDNDHAASLDRAIAAVKSQLVSAERIRSVAEDASDRLRVLDAQLDEAVARAVELSVKADDVGDISPLTNDVDSLVGELESLRQGLEEARVERLVQHRPHPQGARRFVRLVASCPIYQLPPP